MVNHRITRISQSVNIGWIATYVYIYTLFFGTREILNLGNYKNEIINLNILILIYILLAFSSFKYNYEKNVPTLTSRKRHLPIYLVVIILPFFNVIKDINNDQIYHAQKSFETLQILIPNGIYQYFSPLELSLRISMIIFALVIFIHVYLSTRSNKINFLVSATELALALISKTIIVDPHPPVRNLLNIISQAIFGINGFSIRFVGIFWVFCSILILAYLLKRFSKISKFDLNLLIISLFTFPVLIHSTYIAESSVIAGTTLALVYTYLTLNDKLDFNKTYKLNFILALVTMIRQSMALTILLMISISILTVVKEGITVRKVQEIFISFTPWLLAVPFLNRTIINGTPATYIQQESDCFPNEINSLDRLDFVFRSNFLWNNLSINFSWIIVLLVPLIIILILIRKFTVTFLVIIMFHFIFTLQFFIIRPILWTTARYQIEYFYPLLILTFVIFSIYNSRKKAIKILLAILIFFNCFTYFSSSQKIQNGEITLKSKNANCKLNYTQFRSEQHFSYTKLLKLNLPPDAGTLVLGNTYGIYPLVLNGISYSQFDNNLELRNNYYVSEDPFEFVTNNKIVQFIVVFDAREVDMIVIDKLLKERKLQKVSYSKLDDNEVKLYKRIK